MKMTALMVMIYGGCGVAAAARMSSHATLGFKLTVLALVLLCSAHLSWRAAARKRRLKNFDTPKPKCLACQKELGAFHRLARHRFCSEQHEKIYLTELETLAMARLGSARAAMTASAANSAGHVPALASATA